ncbi:MAG: ABC transporter ATP-binding protein [Planctomycetota bacterium]|jgi:ABC-type multidrug transport system ATPase subunit
MSGAVVIRDVAKSFGTIQALKGVSFEVPMRSIYGLLGPNGAGKTTLLSIAAHFLKPDAGSVEVLGIDVRRISELRSRLTILPQDALFQRNVPIVEQLAFFRMLDGRTRKDAEADARRTLEQVGLGEYIHRRVHALSHGMIKRLGLAQAFLGEPEVILLDEPTSGLDPANSRQIRDLIRQLHEQRATVVVSSHNLAEVQELCDHVAILDVGTLVACAPIEELTQSGRKLELRLSRPLNEPELEGLLRLAGVTACDPGDRDAQYTVSLDLSEANLDIDGVTAALLRALLDLGVTPREVSEGGSLESIFLKLTGRQRGEPTPPPPSP